MVPDSLVLRATMLAPGFPAAVGHILEALERASYPPVERWAVPADSAPRQASLAEWLSAHGAVSTLSTARIWLDERRLIDLYRDRTRPDLWQVIVDHPVSTRQETLGGRLITAAIEASTRLLAAAPVEQLEVYRQGGGANCLPAVPLAGSHTYAVVASASAIDRAYDDPEVFWRAGWSRTEGFDGRTLFIRAQDAVDNVQFLTAVQSHQWAMARAAKPGLTRYFLPALTADETAVYRRGGPFLHTVGHLAGENLIELSCDLPPGEHLPGWEILNVFGLLQRGSLPDGRKVEAVRVVFFDRASAEIEKRPLLDVGASVFCQGDTGDLVPVGD